jgi:hypothetical protein
MGPRKTSPSAVLIALLSIGMSVHAVFRGRLGARVREGGAVPLAVAVACAFFGFFLEGAAGAARESEAAEVARQAAPPAVIVPAFEPRIPREGAAALGDPRAAHEVLLFLDPAQEASRRLLREALDAFPEKGEPRPEAVDVLLHVYVKGRALRAEARAILDGIARGDLLPSAPPTPLLQRHAAAANVTEYPTAIWKGGRRSGAFTLAELLPAKR